MESESLAKESESESGDPLSRLLFVFKVTRNPATLFGNSHTGIRISKLCSAVLRARKLFWASHWHCNFDGTDKVHWQALFHVRSHLLLAPLQHADIGWPTGNGKKLSCSQVGQATCLAVGSFFPFPVGHPMSAGCTELSKIMALPFLGRILKHLQQPFMP